jgi:peroxiredoxin
MTVALLVVVAVLLGLVLITQWTVFVQLLKQQGRILLRLDQLEQLWAYGGAGQAPVAPTAPLGLDVGTSAPSFRLPDLDGQEVALEALRGRRVLLVHWSPHCGFCDLIASDLAKLQPELRKQSTQLLLLAHGDAAANRKLAEEHGLEGPILLQADGQAVELFGNLGTPAAYLLDEEGRVAAPLVVGADQVPGLAGEAGGSLEGRRKRLPGERPLSESRIERGGLAAGTLAPAFALPDLRGETVSLEAYRGRKVLLVFSDPHCGPCDQLLPQLNRLHRRHQDNALAVLMVGRGDPDENRRKAEEHRIEFPVALQKKWELSRQYGIFDTPVAFLIDEQGSIAGDVARGADQVLALAEMACAPDPMEVRNGRVLR